MPLRIISDGTYDNPTIICDHCGQRIEKASQGNYQFKMQASQQEGGAAVFFTHKGCTTAFDKTDAGRGTGALELEFLLAYLLNGLAVDLEKARARTAILDLIEP